MSAGPRETDTAARSGAVPPDRPVGWPELFDPRARAQDSTVQFLGIAQALAQHAAVIADVGCGRGAPASVATGHPFQDLRGPGRTVIGLDVDPAGRENPVIDEFRQIESNRWDLDERSVDLVVSDWTLEHVDDADAFVAELSRVLRPGGAFVARTVSRHSVLAWAARAVPNARHANTIARLQPGRESRDVFPTRYAMNSAARLHELLDPGFELSVVHCTGLTHYFGPWPRMARTVAAVEPRLPRAMHATLVVYGRRRGTSA